MKSRSFLFLGLGLIAIFAYVLTKALSMSPQDRPSQLIGKPAPLFALESLQKVGTTEADSAPLALEQLKGAPLVLNFWASWCDSCQEEARELEALWKKYRGQGLRVLGIAIFDQKTEAAAAIKSFGKTYDIAIDAEGHTAIEYGVTGVPETFFIDARGVIQERVAGPMDLAALEQQLSKIMVPKDLSSR